MKTQIPDKKKRLIRSLYKSTSAITVFHRIILISFSLLACPALSQIQLVKDINSLQGQGSTPYGFIERDGLLYFVANDGEHGSELWRTNGNSNGTQLVKDINPGMANGVSIGAKMTVFSNKLYFLANDGQHGTELWSSDQTSVSMVEDLRPGNNSNHIFFLTIVNNKLLFQASPVIGDVEWWRVNSNNSVEIVKDIRPGSAGAQLGSPKAGTDRIFFEADPGGGQGSQLWVSDGTEAGTKSIKEETRVGIGEGVEYNGNVYFMAEESGFDGFELFKADQFGASMVRNINPDQFGGCEPKAVDFHGTVYKGNLYFNAFEPTHADALWKTDGTETGTLIVKDIYPGSNQEKGYIGVMKVYGDYLYFTAEDDTPGIDLWRTDGTETGTIKVKDFQGGISGSFYELDGKLYFLGNDGLHGTELWVSDGTEEGTKIVEDFNPGPSQGVSGIAVFEGKIFLSGNGPSGYELYVYTPFNCEPPQITTHPIGGTFKEGESIKLYIVSSGSGLNYQWQKDNVDIPGATMPAFTISNASLEDNGKYICHVTNSCTTVTSQEGYIIVEEDIVLGAEGSEKNNAVTFFPNPANQWLRITTKIAKGNGETFIFIFNVQGSLVMQTALDIDDNILNVAKLSPGLYQIVIQSSGFTSTSSRFTVQR